MVIKREYWLNVMKTACATNKNVNNLQTDVIFSIYDTKVSLQITYDVTSDLTCFTNFIVKIYYTFLSRKSHNLTFLNILV